MTDLDYFVKAMDGDWRVERYELEGERLRVHYRSVDYPLVAWTHLPDKFEDVPPVGTVGRMRIGFNWTRP
jgi:hypothetical protein